MKVETRIVLKADEGKVLTDGVAYGTIIMLAEGRSADEFYEITKEEHDAIMAESLDTEIGENHVEVENDGNNT